MPTNWTNLRTDFTGEPWDFGALLDAALKLLRANIDVVQTDLEGGITALHGRGFEGDGTILRTGSGLSCIVGSGPTDYYWVDGRRYAIAEAGGNVLSLPANTTSHVYMKADGTGTIRALKLEATPAGEWYCGSVVTTAGACTVVDESLADRISSQAALRTSLLALVAAIGMPYLSSSTITERLAVLEAGGSAGVDPISWAALQKQFGTDPTTIVQEITAQLAAHVTAQHGETTDDGAAVVEVALTRWNAEATRNGKLSLLICRTLNPNIFDHLPDQAAVVWGIWGDGSNGSPNNVDPASTWVYTP